MRPERTIADLQRIRTLRDEQGWTLDEVAEEMGVSRKHITALYRQAQALVKMRNDYPGWMTTRTRRVLWEEFGSYDEVLAAYRQLGPRGFDVRLRSKPGVGSGVVDNILLWAASVR